MILTSNRTRELHDALRRRCLYHWIGYPAAEREVEIVLVREPAAAEQLTRKVVAAVHRLRELDLAKPPGVAETIDWVRTLGFLGETDLTPQAAADTLGAVIKDRDDLDLVREQPGGDHLRWLTQRRSPTCWSGSRAQLRAAGLTVGTGDVLTYCSAMVAARSVRPGGPVLGRAGRRWSADATTSPSTTGCSAVLPGRGRPGRRAC